MNRSAKQSFYFLGIAGAGTSALASILMSEGHSVSGSDAGIFPPVSTYLDRLGIKYYTDFDVAHIADDTDVAIIGTTAKIDPVTNVEYAAILDRQIPHYTFAEYLGQYTRDRENIVVAGSFGKSTLTALITYLLKAAGRNPGYFIGAVPLDLDRTGDAGSDDIFVMEGDEYIVSAENRKAKFMFYNPNHVLISSLIHDHINVFPTIEEYEQPFKDLIGLIPPEGTLVCAYQYEALHHLAEGRRVVWYGTDKCSGYYAEDMAVGEITHFTLVTPQGMKLPLKTQLLGVHNIENIIGAAAMLLERGLASPADIQRALPAFRGVARRLDKKTTHAATPVYEGFGSSYEKARSAIDAMLLHFPSRPLVVVFEPHTFSWRNADALPWYDTVFDGVSRVLLMAPPTHGAAKHHQLSQDAIVDRVRDAGVAVEPMASGAAVLNALPASLKGDEVILLLSSGPLDGLPESLTKVLDGTPETANILKIK